MGRCLSPCLGDLDPNLYRERLDEALGLFEDDGGAALLAHVEAQMRAASAAQRYERAAWLRRRARRLESLLGRLGGALRAAHAGRGSCSRRTRRRRGAPTRSGSSPAGSPTGARCRPTPTSSRRARGSRWRAPAGGGGWLPADELVEARIVGSWLAGHEDAPVLELGARPDARPRWPPRRAGPGARRPSRRAGSRPPTRRQAAPDVGRARLLRGDGDQHGALQVPQLGHAVLEVGLDALRRGVRGGEVLRQHGERALDVLLGGRAAAGCARARRGR